VPSATSTDRTASALADAPDNVSAATKPIATSTRFTKPPRFGPPLDAADLINGAALDRTQPPLKANTVRTIVPTRPWGSVGLVK
jgi:hypothetical protein